MPGIAPSGGSARTRSGSGEAVLWRNGRCGTICKALLVGMRASERDPFLVEHTRWRSTESWAPRQKIERWPGSRMSWHSAPGSHEGSSLLEAMAGLEPATCRLRRAPRRRGVTQGCEPPSASGGIRRPSEAPRTAPTHPRRSLRRRAWCRSALPRMGRPGDRVVEGLSASGSPRGGAPIGGLG